MDADTLTLLPLQEAEVDTTGVEEGTFCAPLREQNPLLSSQYLTFPHMIIKPCLYSSSYGANNKTHTPFIYEIDGGGGGGSSFGGGCNLGTFFTLPG
jgi:hypothetical protein